MATTKRNATFPETRWSIIQRAAASGAATSRAALEDLCRLYWPPLYAFLRRSGQSPEESKDLVQGYLARLLEREDLAKIGPEKGRFRSYLLAGLRNFLVSEIRRDTAQKRGGDASPLSLDLNLDDAENEYAVSLIDAATPDLAFDRRWAESIVERSLDTLRAEYAQRGKARLYETLKTSVADNNEDNYGTLGRELEMTPGAVAVAVHRLRVRFRELVRAEVAQTVGSAADLDEEMRSLFAALSR